MWRNGLCNFCRVLYEDHFCEMILNLCQWIKEMSFKDISFISSGGHFVKRSKTDAAVFVEGIMRNISVKLS